MLILLCAGAGLILGNNHFALRALAVIGILASIRIWQKARSRITNGISGNTAAVPVTRWFWFLGAALAILSAGSFYALVKDAEGGYHEIVPVYAFAAAALFFSLWVSVLAARLSR
jgi:hypothetical protein